MPPLSPECEETQITSPFGTLIPLEKKLKQPPKTTHRKVILISGPTACGKTALSLILAELLKGEIVSADSMQVYKGMDIGTAKISEEDQSRIPHHLIDIRNIEQSFNVVDFYYEARQCCESILARDRVPILVGGSGFYFRTFLYGPPEGPPSVPEVRHALEEEMEVLGSQALYDQLKEKDPTYAASITLNDRQKIVRALEIITLTGEKVSRLDWKKHHPIPDFSYHCWFLHRPRDVLYPAIDARCEQMLETGFVEEVEELVKQGLRNNPSASQAIGYRQCLQYLEGERTAENYEHFARAFKKASRNYAKRQFTWFRKEPLFNWLDVEAHDLETAAEMIAQEFLAVT